MNQPEPMPERESEKKKTPWWLPIVVIVGALPAVFAVAIFVIIVRYSVAHDPDNCPYVLGAVRDVNDGIAVREDTRQCMDDVEDHRWVVVRDGDEDLPLGNLPLMGTSVTVGWEAHLDDGRVVVDVEIPDRGSLTFREPERGVGLE